MANYALSATQAIVDYLWSNLTATNSNVTAGKILEADDYQADLLNGPVLNIIPIFPFLCRSRILKSHIWI